MKPIQITPLWMSLALAVSPLVQANEAPQATQPVAATAEAQQAAPAAPQEDALTGLQKQVESMNKAVTEARGETAAASGQRDAAVKEAKAVREAQKQLEGQMADLRKQLEASNHEVWQWKDKAGTLQKKLGAGEEAYQKLANFRDEMTTALKEFGTLKGELAQVRGELQAPAERVALKKELADAQAAKEQVAKKLEDEAKAHAESKRQLVAKDGFVNELKKAMEDLKASAKSHYDAMVQAQQEREDMSKLLGATQEQLQVSINENSGLVKAKAGVEKDLKAARTELAATQETLAMLQKDAAQLRDTLKPLAAEIQSAKEQTSKATSAIQEASAARELAMQERDKAQAELKEASSQLATAMANQNGLKEQVASKTTEIEGLRKKVEEMEAKLASRQPEEKGQESASR